MNYEAIHKFLRDRTPDWICDDCLSKGASVEPRQQVNPLTNILGLTTDFATDKFGTCSICHKTKKVTRSLRYGAS